MNWQTKKLEEIADFQKGKLMQNSTIKTEGTTPYILIDDLRTNKFTHYTSSNNGTACVSKDTLLAWDGANAGTVGGGLEGFVGSTITKISPKEEVEPVYLRMFLFSKFKEFNSHTHGAAVPHLDKDFVLSYPIPLPPIDKQKEIVKKLGAIKKLQELNQKEIEKAKELFNSFVTNQLVVNKDVKLSKFDDIAEFQYGLTAEGKEEGNYRFIRITDIDEAGQLRNIDKKYVEADKNQVEKYLLKDGDLLVARTGATYGKFVYCEPQEPSVFASYLIKLTFKPELVLPRFVWLFTRTESYWIQARKLVTGSGQPQFNANRIKEIEILLPPLNKQKEIVLKAEQLLIYCNGLKKDQMILKELFESTLNKAMRGELVN